MTNASAPSEDDEQTNDTAAEWDGAVAPPPATFYYTAIGIGVVAGVAAMAAIGLRNPGGFGWFELGTAMVMIGLGFATAFIALSMSLFMLGRTLRAVERRVVTLAQKTSHQIVYDYATQHGQQIDDHRRNIEMLAGAVDQHATDIGRLEIAVQAAEAAVGDAQSFAEIKLTGAMDEAAQKHTDLRRALAAETRARSDAVERLTREIDQVEAREEYDAAQTTERFAADEQALEEEAAERAKQIQALKARNTKLARRLTEDEKAIEAEADEEARLKRRLDNAARARRDAVKKLQDHEARLEKQAARNERKVNDAVKRLESERVRLDGLYRKIAREEQRRRREFEAFAGEEIKIMGHILQRNAAHGSESAKKALADAAVDDYWVERPKDEEAGPFGLVYRVTEIPGVNARHAGLLRKINVRTSEDLWRANTGYVADYLDEDRETVETWQEEAELMAIDGIGQQYAQALVNAGVTSVEKLGSERPDHVVKLVTPRGKSADVDPATAPSAKVAETWIRAAKKLAPTK